ncbi:hypothetical protein [Escherichia coli]|uniref:hypothetical protein n=1 Tax=Escherichia coli TaxID=562 RepID=UPI0002F54089|nr:hypothetical protein [Escherichia coli]
MKQMSLIEMDGFLKGKCIPRDLKVNETNAEYLVRKFAEAEAKISALSEDHQKAIESIKQADAAVKLAHEKFSALAAENAGLKSGVTYFAYSPEYGFDYFKDKQSAIDTAQAEIDAYREDVENGWNEDVQRISWGIVVQQAQGFDAQGLHTSDIRHTYQTCDYRLVDAVETPATDSFLSEVRAQGVEMFSEKFGGGTPLSNMVKEIAADFAAQLRKGGNQ